ncbi:LLM class flavin-dependent oxidoreductase [Nocardia pseudovaccinii]|uniref:LLM class flavin-dependent oxidoreductase n=1 Tax=Nocardia pseudovaccinii TaxID=189540 RepID=UPI0007A3CCEE|nr:LLM class flavin-dependent oxidoreductase [Nocardia pseudovaccinii]
MTVLGAVSMPQVSPEHLAALAAAAEDSGLEELWLWEDCFWAGGITTAATVLARTERVRVGIGVMPVPLRNVALTAMEVAALLRLYPGRVIPGFGHGVQDWMGQIGARVESPMTLLREHLVALRGLLNGEKVSAAGRYVHLDNVALEWPPTTSPPITAAATGPQTLRLSGELADATILTGRTTPDGVRAARARIEEGRAKAARTEPHRVIVNLLTATGPDAAERLTAAQQRNSSEHPPEAGVAGDAQAVADAVRRYADAGADTVVLEPTDDDPNLIEFVRFAGAEVRPLLN